MYRSKFEKHQSGDCYTCLVTRVAARRHSNAWLLYKRFEQILWNSIAHASLLKLITSCLNRNVQMLQKTVVRFSVSVKKLNRQESPAQVHCKETKRLLVSKSPAGMVYNVSSTAVLKHSKLQQGAEEKPINQILLLYPLSVLQTPLESYQSESEL